MASIFPSVHLSRVWCVCARCSGFTASWVHDCVFCSVPPGSIYSWEAVATTDQHFIPSYCPPVEPQIECMLCIHLMECMSHVHLSAILHQLVLIPCIPNRCMTTCTLPISINVHIPISMYVQFHTLTQEHTTRIVDYVRAVCAHVVCTLGSCSSYSCGWEKRNPTTHIYVLCGI